MSTCILRCFGQGLLAHLGALGQDLLAHLGALGQGLLAHLGALGQTLFIVPVFQDVILFGGSNK